MPSPTASTGWTTTPRADQVWRVESSSEAGQLTLVLPGATAGLHGFTSSWGMEFTPISGTDQLQVEVTSGRSGQGALPWLGVETNDGWWVLTLHWSGNWSIDAHGSDDQTQVRVGYPDQLSAGEQPAVTLAWGGSRFDAAARLTSDLAGQAPRSAPMLAEWNHWWPYEDAEISEDVFLENARIASKLGFEIAVLDAGWFGAPGDTEWYRVRGDWEVVNTQRFPHGLAWLADRTRELGIEFGVWIEAEALGVDAVVQESMPEIVARDAAGESLGYVCLGSPAGLARVHEQVRALASSTKARWIKWDFNLDPGAGCQRDDHGHSSSNGLRAHYEALYALFDDLRTEFGQTTWEACSSGGLRIDAGLAEHVDGFFLSDPDWTEHHLKVLWGASQMIPARQILHWVQSEWRGEHRFQKADYSGTLLKASAFDAKVRSAMLHRLGVSVRLPHMRDDLRQRLADHVEVWKSIVRPLLDEGVLRPLAGQPEIAEQGHRQPAWQLSSGERHVIGAFRLPPQWQWSPVVPVGLDRDANYRISVLAPGEDEVTESVVVTGAQLLDQGMPTPPQSKDSALWLLEWVA